MPPTTKFPVTIGKKPHQVKIYRTHNGGGYYRYEVRYKVGKVWKKERISDIVKARYRAEEVAADLRDAAFHRLDVPAEQIHYWRSCESMLEDGVSLMDAVKFYLTHREAHEVGLMKKFPDVVDEFIKSREHRSKRYYDSLRWALDPAKEAFRAMPIAGIKPTHIDRFLERYSAPRTKYNARGYLSTLFGWARKKGYLPFGEPHAVERTDSITLPPTNPGIVSPADMRKILRHAVEIRPKLVPWIVLGAFAGIRSAERERLCWEDVKWSENSIALSGEVTKTNRRRVVEMPPNLRAWLEAHRGEGTMSPYNAPNSAMADTCNDLGLTLPHNALRHSFVSYHLALHKKSHDTSEITGHSVSVLQSNYKAIAYPSDAMEWFNILPDS